MPVMILGPKDPDVVAKLVIVTEVLPDPGPRLIEDVD